MSDMSIAVYYTTVSKKYDILSKISYQNPKMPSVTHRGDGRHLEFYFPTYALQESP